MQHAVILADPPWEYDKWKGDQGGRTAESYYPTLSLAELIAMRPQIDAWAARDCILFLWVTPPKIADGGLPLVDAWGFTYKTFAFTWIKTNKGNGKPCIGMGSYTRSNAEVCLLAIRGKPTIKDKAVSQVIIAPRREHSRKPDEQYERIERLMDGPYLELFARFRREGWTSWGNQLTDRYTHRARQFALDL